VRKNVAAAHRHEALVAGNDPWNAAFTAAEAVVTGHGEFAPYWIYPGAAKVERQLISHPLSRDVAKIQGLKDALALYRLTMGQARQQDMLDMMQRRGVESRSVALLDLRP
jgi:hypothetical protein